MFSTVENVGNHIRNVENYRKTDVFAWKTIGFHVGKSTDVENTQAEKLQIQPYQGFAVL